MLRINKHLRVVDKNTQEALHPELMKPHIPPLARDQISSGLHLSQLPAHCVPLISRLCLQRENNFISYANYSTLAVHSFVLSWAYINGNQCNERLCFHCKIFE